MAIYGWPTIGRREKTGTIMRKHSRGGQEDDVNPGMAKEPEELLPKDGIAAIGDLKEVRAPAPVQFHKDASNRQRRQRKQDDKGDRKRAVKKQRHAADRHSRSTQPQNGDDEVDGAAGRRDRQKDQRERVKIQPIARANNWMPCIRHVGKPSPVRRLADGWRDVEQNAGEAGRPSR